MRQIQTEVLVIGGGATGTGVARDLAMRGFKTTLVEKGDLSHGTTGRYHGLLHSGGRYVVKDTQTARECIEENHILRRIMPHCIEDTGGFFVLTPWDDPEYAARFLAGCQQTGIPVEEISTNQMLRTEPLLNPKITRCFHVPDASADSFLAASVNADSARQYGAQILNYHKVKHLETEKSHVTAALCHDLEKDEQVVIRADLFVNATGAWAGQFAKNVHIIPGKGVMIAVNHRIVNTVINRCKMPSNGDILVPAHTVAVIGTTDVPVNDPDHFAIEPWEINLMLEEGEKLVPGFKEMRMLRAWAGVRPLYQETSVSDTRDVTRSFVLLDHAKRDGIDGIVTITSGKWTTYRKMAEVTVDLVCKKLDTRRECRTHLEALPMSETHAGRSKYHSLGMRLSKIEKEQAFGQLVCECELATYQDVAHAITEGEAKTIDDIRRAVRLGMGPCQGGFCTYRAAGILHKLRHPDVRETNVALRDFLQERWKGLLPILWGQQLRQERLDELIYLSLLNTDHLPGPRTSPFSPTPYQPAAQENGNGGAPATPGSPTFPNAPCSAIGKQPDVIVIGAGLAGLSTAWQLSSRGKRVRLITKGWGALYWHAGCIDLLGFYPDQDQAVNSPAQSLQALIQAQPEHPYARLGITAIQEALTAFQELCTAAGYPLHGSIEKNWLLPSALGAFRPTCLAPETMIAGDLRRSEPMLVVGFEGFPDFYPDLIADNLSAQGIPAFGLTLKLPSLDESCSATGRVLANLFEKPDFRAEVVKALQHKLDSSPYNQAARIGFPAVLGISRPIEVKGLLEKSIGLPVFEIPTLPPSIPGIRLSRLLIDAIEKMDGRVFDGMQVIASEPENATTHQRLAMVWSEAASRHRPHRAAKFVLATGGILGGGLRAEYLTATQGKLCEIVCDLPIKAPVERDAWLQCQFLGQEAHPLYNAGIAVDTQFQPVDFEGHTIYNNLYAVGAALANAECLRERSIDGVTLATGYFVGKSI